jgi:ABC-2 type transport system ATP-binding protein
LLFIMHHESCILNRFPMIETFDLTKRFGSLIAVKSLSLRVARGEVFGLLGPNGAGKTTTIRMLTTLSAPTSGSARVAGFDVTTDPLSVKRSIGVVPQTLNLDIDLTAAENLEYHGRLHRMQADDRAGRSEEPSASSGSGKAGHAR